MSKLRRPARETQRVVAPSSRDSISGWLDVLTSMLAIPESQRFQVRDELEDHLRSRVDDLLITGTPEPEAIRQAVAELGETAELAKLISHAHTHSKPRRRIMNAALIMTVIGGLSIGGLSLNSGSVPAQKAQEEAGALLQLEARPRVLEGVSVELDMNDARMIDVLNGIADAFGKDLELSPGSREMVLMSNFSNSGWGFKGSFTMAEALDMFRSVFAVDFLGHEVIAKNDSIRVMTEDEFMRSEVVTRVYPVPSWITKANEVHDYSLSLHRLLEVKHDLQYASIEVVDEAIVVAAPPKIQEEVLKMMLELDAIVQNRRAERKAEQEQRDALNEAKAKIVLEQQRKDFEQMQIQRELELAKTIERVQEEFDLARKEYLACSQRIRRLEIRQYQLQNADGSTEEKRREVDSELADISIMFDDLHLELEEREERYTYLRSRLLDSQYAHLFSGLE